MELRKHELNRDQVARYFPELLDDNPTYRYFIEVSALKRTGLKTVQSLWCGTCRERHDGDFIFREMLPHGAVCIRASLPKPMRQAQRDEIYHLAKQALDLKLQELMTKKLIDSDHPFVRTVSTM